MKHIARVGMLWLAVSALPACELIVDFDRSKVVPDDAGAPPDDSDRMDGGGRDAASPDAGAGDGGDDLDDDDAGL